MGRPRDPDYWKKWRAAHPEYLERERNRRRNRRQAMTPEERRKDRGTPPPKPVQEPLPMLMPHLQHGSALSFWDDELRLDLAQEAELAALEGRDTASAVHSYRKRERIWRAMTCPYLMDGLED